MARDSNHECCSQHGDMNEAVVVKMMMTKRFVEVKMVTVKEVVEVKMIMVEGCVDVKIMMVKSNNDSEGGCGSQYDAGKRGC